MLLNKKLFCALGLHTHKKDRLLKSRPLQGLVRSVGKTSHGQCRERVTVTQRGGIRRRDVQVFELLWMLGRIDVANRLGMVKIVILQRLNRQGLIHRRKVAC